MFVTSIILFIFRLTFAITATDTPDFKSCQVPPLVHGSLHKSSENKKQYFTNETITLQCKEHYIFPDRTVTKDFTCQEGSWIPGIEDCYEFCHPYCLLGKCKKSGIGRCDEGKCQEKAVYNATSKTCTYENNNFPTTKVLIGGLLGGHLLGIIISFIAVAIYARRRRPKKYYGISAK